MVDKLEDFLDNVIDELTLTELNLLSQIIHQLTEKKLRSAVAEYNLNKKENLN